MQQGLPLATSLLSNTTKIDKVCLASSVSPAHPDHPDNPEHFYYADHHDNLITPTTRIIPVTRVLNDVAKWPPPPPIWTKSKRTAVFPRATVPNHSIIPTTTITLTGQVIFEEHKFRILLLGLVFN